MKGCQTTALRLLPALVSKILLECKFKMFTPLSIDSPTLIMLFYFPSTIGSLFFTVKSQTYTDLRITINSI